MKLKVLLIVCLSCLGISLPAQYYATSSSLNMDGALKLAQEAVSEVWYLQTLSAHHHYGL